ncbi:hypothetical protein [Hankyongella ginsenosidimutans]|uniref:hypothetical protein n=1 Tax=Hankyongella ginsenosidimutans TaxID=1763828 RepID=UPI001CA334B2|nr:hypothetical protein [Hankyongella ginsenosidimutans]
MISPATDPYLRRNAFLLMSSEKAAKRLDTLSSASTLLESVTTEASLPSIVGALAKAQDLSSSAGGQIDTAQLKHATDAVTETIDARLQEIRDRCRGNRCSTRSLRRSPSGC